MKKILLMAVPLLMSGECRAEDITIRYKGTTAKVEQRVRDSVSVTVDGARVNIESLYKSHRLTLRLTGKSDDGQLVLKSAGKAMVTLDGLTLTSEEGAPIELKNKKKVELKVAKGTVNTLTITACNDTANHKAAAIWAKDKLLLSGKGTLNVVATGDGCRGIKTKKDVAARGTHAQRDNLGQQPRREAFRIRGIPRLWRGRYARLQQVLSLRQRQHTSRRLPVRTFTAGAEGIEGKQGIVFLIRF